MPNTLRKPITDDTAFTITPEGIAALDAAAAPGVCPKCGGRLGIMYPHVGGHGSLPWDYCKNMACDYWKRSA